MRQNFIANHIPILSVPFTQTPYNVKSYFAGAISTQHGYSVGTVDAGRCIALDLDSDALFSYEFSWKWDAGVPADFHAFVFTGVTANSVGSKTYSLTNLHFQPCPLRFADSDRRATTGRAVVPKLELASGQVQVVGIAVLNAETPDVEFSMRVHDHDVVVFDPLR